MAKYPKLVLNEPHASIEGLYNPALSYWMIDDNFINNLIVKWTDWHTDYLFHGLTHPNLFTVRFPYSRFIVDAERLWNDPLESKGQGIVYLQMENYTRNIPNDRKLQLLNIWKWHQARLKSVLSEGALLLDCHSFPDESDADICIGFNEDWSKPQASTIEKAVNLFEENGYKVGINSPYSNSITPSCPFRYESMMIEVNKRVYLEKDSIKLKPQRGFKKGIRELLTSLMASYLCDARTN